MANQQGGRGSSQGKSDRGFAAMDDDKQREIARKGGESVPDDKRSFSQDPKLASEAGRKGGEASGGGNRR
jgi:general stress protein YciG